MGGGVPTTPMYAVVGCDECSALWVLEGRPDTTSCPRCEKRHQVDRLRSLAEAASADAAKAARSRLLVERSGVETDLGDFGAQGDAVADAGVDETAYLEAAGIDPEEVAEAGDIATSRGGSRSPRDVVRDALETLDRPTADEVGAWAGERGVDRDAVERTLARLREEGAVSVSGGRYRLL